MAETYTTAWQRVSNGETTSLTPSNLTPAATTITDAEIQWRGVETSSSSFETKWSGWNEKTIENSDSPNPRQRIVTRQGTDGFSYNLADSLFVPDGEEGVRVSGDFIENQLEIIVDLDERTTERDTTSSGEGSVSHTVDVDNTLYSDKRLDSYAAYAYIDTEPVDVAQDVTVDITRADGTQNTYTVTVTGDNDIIAINSWTVPDPSPPATITADVTDGNGAVRSININTVETLYKSFSVEYQRLDGTYLSETGLLMDGSGKTTIHQNTPSTDYRNTDETRTVSRQSGVQNVKIEAKLRTFYQPYSWVEDIVAAPSAPDGYYDINREYEVSVTEGKMGYVRYNATDGQWSGYQTTTTSDSEFDPLYEDGTSDLQINTAVDATKVIGTGRVRTEGRKNTTTYYQTQDPSVTGDVSGIHYGELADDEVSPWEPLDGLATETNNITHDIEESGEAEFRIRYTYVTEPPQPSIGVLGFYVPSDETWYEVAVADPSNDRLSTNALQLSDGTEWGAVDIVSDGHPDEAPAIRVYDGSEWRSFRIYDTTPK